MRDLLSRLQFAKAIAPSAATTDNTAYVSSIIDTIGYESVVFAILTGVEADADATFTVLVEAGDQANLSDAAAATGTQLSGTTALANFDFSADNAVRKIGYVGPRRYVRLTITPAANTGNVFLAAVAVLGNARFAPTPNPPT